MEENKNIQNEQSTETSATEAAEKTGFFANKKNVYIVAAIAAVAIVAGIVLAVVLGGGEDTPVDNDDETAGDVDNDNGGEGGEDEKDENDGGETVKLAYKDATELLNAILSGYNATASEETMLYVSGGNSLNFDTISFDSPAKFVPVEDSDYDTQLALPADFASKVDDAASMYNMMNVNIFNCGAFHFADAADAEAVISKIEENVRGRQWMCGSPEKFAIISAPGNYVIIMWGAASFGGIVDDVINSVVTSVEGAEIKIHDEVIR